VANGDRYPSLQERIIANTVTLDGVGMTLPDGTWSYCWIWTGKRVKSRDRGPGSTDKWYGIISTRYKSGKRKGKVKSIRVHRLVLELFKNRRMTPKSVGMHLCTNSLCACPDHLVGGTQRQNVRQSVKDGTHRNGYSEPRLGA